jgi:hypothetical protein
MIGMDYMKQCECMMCVFIYTQLACEIPYTNRLTNSAMFCVCVMSVR